MQKIAHNSKIKHDAFDYLKSIVSAKSEPEINNIKKLSAETTEKLFCKKFYFRGVIEFSNVCEKDCYYCGIRKSNKNVSRYLMPIDETIKQAEWAYKSGYGSVVLQSGECKNKDFIDYVIKAVERIKKFSNKNRDGKELAIVLSIGEQKKKAYEELFNAGANRYLLRIETSNPKLYKRIHPKNHSFRKRDKCLQYLKEIGYQVGSGIMIGLPEQKIEDLVLDILYFKEKDIDMLGMGPYIIHKDTPIGKDYGKEWQERKNGIFQLSLNMIAAGRIFLKDINIASTTALQALNPFGREIGLQYGANIVMPIITPKKYRADYLLYENKPCIDEDAIDCMECLIKRVNSTGKEVALFEVGNPIHYTLKSEKK